MPLTRSCLWQIPSSKPVSLVGSLEILYVRLRAVCRPCFFEGQRAVSMSRVCWTGHGVDARLADHWRERSGGGCTAGQYTSRR